MTLPLHYTPIETLGIMLRRREISSLELIDHFIQRIESLNPSLNAIITLVADDARQLAQQADHIIKVGGDLTSKPLLGIPLTVKDAVATRGIRTTANSRTLGDWVPDFEPLAISHLREAGAIILAKANCNEYFGIPSEEDRFPRPRTPYNTDYVAIGSSSGSGVAVAAGFCAASIGTDAAGSVRLPAAQAGVVGMKTTNGCITLEDVGRQSSFLTVGSLARTISDTALLTATMAGEAVPDLRPQSLHELRVGVPWQYIETSPVEDEIKQAFHNLLDLLKSEGAQICDISIPGLAETRMATFVAMYTEHHAAHAAALRRQLNDYGRSARLYALQGAFISAADYLNALELGRRVRRNVDHALADVDVIAMPTSPFVTAEAARKPSEHRRGMNTVFTVPFNMTGHPAITVPCGMSSLGIPIGAQFAAAHHAEELLYRLSLAIEQQSDWHRINPNI